MYTAEDPRDPEKGHGAALAKRLAPDAPAYLVPDAAIFGEPPADLAKDDPLRKEYLEKGWREVLLREYFFESLLLEHLTAAIESRKKVEEWQGKVDRKVENPGEKPAEVTLASLLEEKLKPYLPNGGAPFLVLVKPEKPLSRTEWEALPDLSDMNWTGMMSGVTGEGQYATIPIPLNRRLGRALSQNLSFEGERPREYDEVRDDPELWKKYTESRRLVRARRELDRLKDLIVAKEGAAEGDARRDAYRVAVEEWAQQVGVPYVLETTGLFIGSRPPSSVRIPEGTPPEEAARLRRRDFVRQTGYASVHPTPEPGADAAYSVLGDFGRQVLVDERTGENATQSAYLVRIIEQAPPPPEEFSPSDYVDVLIRRFYGDLASARARSLPQELSQRKGLISETLSAYLDNPTSIQRKFELKTKVELSAPASE
jgi:hypothetical protein